MRKCITNANALQKDANLYKQFHVRLNNEYISSQSKRYLISKTNQHRSSIIFNPQRQHTVLKSCLTRKSSQGEISHSDSYQRSILVVEDNQINQKVMRSFLQELHYKNIDFVSNGTHAMLLVTAQIYDLILLDIGLPDIHGIELCKQIRKLDCYKNKPIIAITAYESSLIEDSCLEVGISKILLKPILIEELQNTLTYYLK